MTTDLVDALLSLWGTPPPDDEEALRVFRALYTDPVPVNGTPLGSADLLARCRGLHRALSGVRHRVLSRSDGPGLIGITFELSGRHVGPLGTALGDVPATDRDVTLRAMDILTVGDDGRIHEVWTIADELRALVALDAVRRVDPATERAGG